MMIFQKKISEKTKKKKKNNFFLNYKLIYIFCVFNLIYLRYIFQKKFL
jgi:hypothetical protein